jgi:NAD(P) transhydrogenase subunit alpha
MTFRIAVPKETLADECRVALVPSQVARFRKLGAEIAIQRGAGDAARFRDSDYKDVEFVDDAQALVANADVVFAAAALAGAGGRDETRRVADELRLPAEGAGAAAGAARRQDLLLRAGKVPRISRAQAMDALSSQAALAGYYAPLLGSVHLPRILPMMTTAVGSLRAAQVLVMGLGVAGLQALATARRLGAVT